MGSRWWHVGRVTPARPALQDASGVCDLLAKSVSLSLSLFCVSGYPCVDVFYLELLLLRSQGSLPADLAETRADL